MPQRAYILEELDGTELRRRYAASHVKIFYSRGVQEDLNEEEELEDLEEEKESEDFLDNSERWLAEEEEDSFDFG